MVNIILASLLFCAAACIVGYVGYCYWTAPDRVLAKASLDPNDTPEYRDATWWDRLIYSTKKSSALFIQLLTAVGVLLVNGIGFLAELAGFPEARMVVERNLSPQTASWFLLALVALTTWARFRKE